MYSGLPRFSYASVASRMALDQAQAEARARDRAGRSGKGRTREGSAGSSATKGGGKSQRGLQSSRTRTRPQLRKRQPHTSQSASGRRRRAGNPSPSSGGGLSRMQSSRSISVATYQPGSPTPSTTQVSVDAVDPATLPAPPIKVKLRSADPRLLKRSESEQQLVHMKYIGLTPEYSRRVERRAQSLPAFKRAEYGKVRSVELLLPHTQHRCSLGKTLSHAAGVWTVGIYPHRTRGWPEEKVCASGSTTQQGSRQLPRRSTCTSTCHYMFATPRR